MLRDFLLLKVSEKMEGPSLSYWPLDIFRYFEEIHDIQSQIEISIWLQTKISESLSEIEHFQKVSSGSQNLP